MLTNTLVSFIKRSLTETGKTFAFVRKPGVLMIEVLPCHSLFFVVWDGGRGGAFRVLPEQHSELYDLVSRRVQIAITRYRGTEKGKRLKQSDRIKPSEKCDRES